MQYSHSASASAAQPAQGMDSSQSQQGPAQPAGQPKFSNGPHIRSRITVVCAECKRLKLKCDRRTPCSSCLKRDTVQRCVYSQAAAEKIDVQSLHNRILTLESALGRLSDAPPSTSVSNALGGMGSFKPPFGSAAAAQSYSAVSSSTGASPNVLAGLPCNEHALLAIGPSGSSVIVSLDDTTSLWLSELDEQGSDHKVGSGAEAGRPSASAARLRLEPASLLNPSSSSRSSFVPPVPYEEFLPSSSLPAHHLSTTSNPYPQSLAQLASTEPPQVTPALLKRLPPPQLRGRHMKALEEVMMLHPCFNVRHFSQRVDAMLAWGDAAITDVLTVSSNGLPGAQGVGTAADGPRTKRDLAHDLFFGAPAYQPGGKAKGKDAGRAQAPYGSPKPTLSFFAAACAAFALGSLVGRAEGEAADLLADSGSAASSPDQGAAGTPAQGSSPAALLALSEQALSLFEKTSSYDLDFIMAMILQILYQLHDGQTSVAQGIFPVVGKMVNVARTMGLAIDPEDFPGTYTLFEAETRRRIWWDVFYYDLMISDCMGQPPLISDSSFTTRLPAEVDEEQFSPSSTTLPNTSGADAIEKSTAYLVLKYRLAQLIKSVKRQTYRDPLGDDLPETSLDHAASLEAEISAFLADVPPAFRLDCEGDLSEPVSLPSSPFVLAQRCELALLANRTVLKLYLPLLKDAAGAKPSHQAVLGTISAAHQVVHAARLLHAAWRRTRPALSEFYDFGRALFEAAVVCAHAVIQQPAGILAGEASKGIAAALDVLRETDAARGGASEAVRILEMMKRKAELARASGAGGSAAGTKRKRSDSESETLSAGFQLPFVGAAVASTKAERGRPLPSPTKSSSFPSLKGPAPVKEDAKKPPPKDKDKEKSRYPPVGVRVRPGQSQPSARQRSTSIVSPPTPALPGGSGSSGSSVAGGTPTTSQPPVPLPPSHSSTLPPGPDALLYDYPPSRPGTRGGAQDYPMRYASEDPGPPDARRYPSSAYDSPAASMFDPAPLAHSPASYTAGAGSSYYVPYAAAYDERMAHGHASHGHGHGHGAQGMMDSYPPPPSKSFNPAPTERIGLLQPQEYQPPPGPPAPAQSMQGWAPPPPPAHSDVWSAHEYKYYAA